MRHFLERNWFFLGLAAGLSIALALPTEVAAATDFLEPRYIIAVALTLMAFTMPSRDLLGELARPWAALWATAISYVAIPLAAWGLTSFLPWPDVRIGILLTASIPSTLASAVLWTRLAHGNDATALLVTVITTLLSWAVTTFWLVTTTGTSVEIDVGRMMGDLVVILIVPVTAGQLARLLRPLRDQANRRSKLLGSIAQLFVLSIIIKAAAQVGLKSREGGDALTLGLLAGCIVATAALHLAALYFGLGSSKLLRFDRPRQIAVAISGSQKTLPLALFLFETYYRSRFPLAVVPLLCYHVGQLLLDALIAKRLVRKSASSVPSREPEGERQVSQ